MQHLGFACAARPRVACYRHHPRSPSRPARPPRASASNDEPQRVAAAAEPEPQAEPEPEGILCFFEPENAEPELTPMELNFSDVILYDGHTRSRQKGA